MAELTLSTVMDSLADQIAAADITQRVYAWPVESVTVPCAVVSYPTDIEFDQAFTRGSDKLLIPVYFLIGKVADRNSRDSLSEIITGMKVLDEDEDTATRVTNARIEEVTVNNIAYLAAIFDCEIYT
jgi:hypothetical protein